MNSLTWPLRVLTLVLVIGAYNTVQVAIVQRRLQFRKVFNATIVSVVLSGGIGVAAAVLNAGLWALVIQQLCYSLCNCVVMAFQVKWRPDFVFKPDRARQLFLLAGNYLFQGFLIKATNHFLI